MGDASATAVVYISTNPVAFSMVSGGNFQKAFWLTAADFSVNMATADVGIIPPPPFPPSIHPPASSDAGAPELIDAE